MRIDKTIMTLGLALTLTVAVLGCKKEPETVGEKLDSAIEKTKDAAKDATDKDGTMEKVGEKLDKAAEATKDAATDAVDATKDAVHDATK